MISDTVDTHFLQDRYDRLILEMAVASNSAEAARLYREARSVLRRIRDMTDIPVGRTLAGVSAEQNNAQPQAACA